MLKWSATFQAYENCFSAAAVAALLAAGANQVQAVFNCMLQELPVLLFAHEQYTRTSKHVLFCSICSVFQQLLSMYSHTAAHLVVGVSLPFNGTV